MVIRCEKKAKKVARDRRTAFPLTAAVQVCDLERWL
jgi:hypothetical protein